VGQVIDLELRRAAAVAQRIEHAQDHPALRWVAGAAFWSAHRKDGAGAACGANGDLTLAPPGVPLCVECFPLAGRQAT
jgi:hypothetical protein